MLVHRRIARERDRALRARFGHSREELRALFPCPLDLTQVSDLQERSLKYPAVSSLVHSLNVNAFYAHFQSESNQVDRIVKGATTGFNRVDENSYVKSAENKGSCHLFISIGEEFSGAILSIISDDISVFERIAEANSSPPPPWVAFPDVDEPLKLGSLQGDLEYWWDGYWLPFWENLSSEERVMYLQKYEATDDWRQCIWLHGTEVSEFLGRALSQSDQE